MLHVNAGALPDQLGQAAPHAPTPRSLSGAVIMGCRIGSSTPSDSGIAANWWAPANYEIPRG